MSVRVWAFGAALGGAVALHLTVFALWQPPVAGGAQSVGAQGADLVAITPASAAMAAVVADWERPPEIAATPKPLAPQTDEATPSALALSDPPLANAAPTAPAPPQAREAPPPPQTAPPPPEMPRPVSKPKPQPKTAKQTAPKAMRASQAAPKQQAKGAGGGVAAGQQGKARAATLSPGQTRAAMAAWGAQIRARIERAKTPPAGAGAGRVIVTLRVARSGQLLSVTLARSSGKAALDRAALQAVRRAGQFAPAPTGLNAQSYAFDLPMAFR
ncbi:MAG: TonB C-terminal domain-containing protein [Rhodobacteraceae bacterium]|nr:TonB C-terminal domain-containing protein [Paracoccaceae bacterium]